MAGELRQIDVPKPAPAKVQHVLVRVNQRLGVYVPRLPTILSGGTPSREGALGLGRGGAGIDIE